MRRLTLDFQRRQTIGWLGWLLLVAGVAALAGLLYARQSMARANALQGARLARVYSPVTAGGARTREQSDDPVLLAARQVLERSRLPWGGLFAALESADGNDVAMLAITPDVAHRQVKIEAEARDLVAMLAFHRHLQQQSALGQVVLLDHTVARESPEAPVRFHILANWGNHNVNP